MSYIYHITLDTGDIATTPRSDASDHALSVLAPHLKRAITTGRDIIPTQNFTLMASHRGGALLATILTMGGLPILTFGVAPTSRVSAKLWDALTSNREYQADPGDPPPAPWIAVRMEAAASQSTLDPWMADYERCIAWAWIEGLAK